MKNSTRAANDLDLKGKVLSPDLCCQSLSDRPILDKSMILELKYVVEIQILMREQKFSRKI